MPTYICRRIQKPAAQQLVHGTRLVCVAARATGVVVARTAAQTNEPLNRRRAARRCIGERPVERPPERTQVGRAWDGSSARSRSRLGAWRMRTWTNVLTSAQQAHPRGCHSTCARVCILSHLVLVSAGVRQARASGAEARQRGAAPFVSGTCELSCRARRRSAHGARQRATAVRCMGSMQRACV